MRALFRTCLCLLAVLASTLVPLEANAFTPPHLEQLAPAELPANNLALQVASIVELEAAPTVELQAQYFTAKTLALNSIVASEVATSSYATISGARKAERSAGISELLTRSHRRLSTSRARLDLK